MVWISVFAIQHVYGPSFWISLGRFQPCLLYPPSRDPLFSHLSISSASRAFSVHPSVDRVLFRLPDLRPCELSAHLARFLSPNLRSCQLSSDFRPISILRCTNLNTPLPLSESSVPCCSLAPYMATAISASVQAARFELDLLSTPFHGRSLLTDHAPSTSSRLACQSRKQAAGARAYVGAPNTGVGASNTLGLNQSASEDDIKKAYRRLAKQYHPDVCKGESCTVKFMQISDAYETMMDFVHGSGDSLQDIAVNYHPEGMMGVNDNSWEDWEEWMGWEGAGTLDYTSFINDAL